MSRPLDRKAVKAGDRLVFSRDERTSCVFKFFGHQGSVVVALCKPIPGRPIDVICRQKDVRHP